MQQLSGLDASFLYLETPNSPMHISGLYIYTQETAPGGKVRFKQIIDSIAARVQHIPSLTRRLKTVPLGLDHPYWIEDGNFDPEFHIRHVALPAPGDWRQLCILVSRIHARPLDRAHPLWEIYVIEGLDGVEGYPPGCFAVFTKMHHAAVDGASGMEITAAIHDLEPDTKVAASEKPRAREREPGVLKLVARSQLNSIRQPLRFISVARNTVPGFARAFMQLRRGELETVGKVPRTRFNSTVSPHRIFTAVSLELAEIKQIKNAVEGATVNDVAVTIVGGALRRYLQTHGELPADSLVAMAPVNVRDDSERGRGGNIVSTMSVLVRSDIEDARERLVAVNQATRNAKEMSRAVGAKSMTDYSQFIPSTLTAQAARLASRWRLVNQMSPIYNCVITNVPGPQVPLYNTGARMISNFGTGPVADGVGLFHVISSYCGECTISATSCRSMMPDPGFYRECLMASFEDVKRAALPAKSRAKSSARRQSKAPAKSAKAKAGAKSRTASAKKAAPKKAPPKKASATKATRKQRPKARPKRTVA